MSAEQQLEQQLFELGEVMAPGTDFTSSVMERIGNSSVAPAKNIEGSAKARPFWSRSRKLLAIVAVAVLMIWLRGIVDHSEVASNDWWLGPSAVYAEEIARTLQQALVEGVIFRSSTTYVREDGTQESAPNVTTVAVIDDRYRYESTTLGQLGSVTWSVPDHDEFVVTKYLAHNNSIKSRRLPREEGLGASPIASLMEISRLIDQAGKRLDPEDIDGRKCVGFEINADKVHQKHDSGIYQIWIDTETKRPAKMIFDRERKVKDDRNIKRAITTMDRFEWNPNLPGDLFVPHENPRPLR